jgi:hypothetical protein
MSDQPNERLIKNKTLRVGMHFFYVLFGVAYILNNFVDYPILRWFKVVPLGLLIMLIVPPSHNRGIMYVILGILCGAAGD